MKARIFSGTSDQDRVDVTESPFTLIHVTVTLK